MKMKQYRVENCLIGGSVVINLNGLNQREIVVPSKGFVFLKEEELSWVLAQSKAFQRGILRVVNSDELPEEIKMDLPTTKDSVTSKEIPYFLSLTQAKLVKEIKDITREDFLRELHDKAVEDNKTVKFVEAIQNRIEEILSERGL